ncbi:MAG: ATPase subunit of ABC transporter with duplicated ATPase domains [Bacillariaceae sp.]
MSKDKDMESSSEAVTRAQLSSLDDTDCYASVWEQILSKQRRTGQSTHIWGGKGKGGRGLGRRTIQPNDVVVEDVRLQYLFGDACLLESATIKLLHNHIYCLLGRNGSGKSTLLKKMHSQMIPGWSVQWSTLYVPPKLPSEYSQLTPIQVLTKYVDECKRNSRLATESLISELENRMDCLDLENEEDEMEHLCEELSMLEDNLDFEDSSLKEQIPDFFRELGFDHEKPCEELSPGQQKEVILCAASVCCSFTNLILLDEPTNDLDVHGLIRLRQLINDNLARSTTVVMVSHDVDLINDVATDIIDMHAKKLWYYPGNYDSYRLMKDQKGTHQLNQSLAMEKKADQLKSSLQNLKEKPTPKRKGGANKKAKSVANHRKKIERHEKSMNTADSSSIISTEGKNLTAAQQLKLAKITKCVPDKAVQFV